MRRAALFLGCSLIYAATVVAVVNHAARRINAATELAGAWLARQDEKAASALGSCDD